MHFWQSVLEEVAFFYGNLCWLWLILANSLRIVGELLRAPDSLGRAIDIGDLWGAARAIDNVAFVRGYADPFLRLVLYVKLLIRCCMGSIFTYQNSIRHHNQSRPSQGHPRRLLPLKQVAKYERRDNTEQTQHTENQRGNQGNRRKPHQITSKPYQAVEQKHRQPGLP